MRAIFEGEADANNRQRLLLITMVVAAGKNNIDKGYEPAHLSEYVAIHMYVYIQIYCGLH